MVHSDAWRRHVSVSAKTVAAPHTPAGCAARTTSGPGQPESWTRSHRTRPGTASSAASPFPGDADGERSSAPSAASKCGWMLTATGSVRNGGRSRDGCAPGAASHWTRNAVPGRGSAPGHARTPGRTIRDAWRCCRRGARGGVRVRHAAARFRQSARPTRSTAHRNASGGER